MIAVYVQRGAEPVTRRSFDHAIRIGADATSDIALPDLDAAIRCELQCTDNKLNWWVVGDGIVVDGEAIPSQQATWVRDGGKLELGPYTITLVMVEPRLTEDATEAILLAQILAGDDGSREVYADLLDERGHDARAELVRLQQPLRDRPPRDLAARMRASCSSAIDLAWRRRISRPAIAGCPQQDCPGDWGRLAPTVQPDTRNCDTCRNIVRYCRSELDAMQGGGRVVLDCLAITDDVAIPATGWLPYDTSRFVGSPMLMGGAQYVDLLRAFYPETRAQGVRVVSASAFPTVMFANHHAVSVVFQRALHEPTRTAVFGIGHLGVARLSQRPSAVAHLLAVEGTVLADPAMAEPLARLLVAAVSPEIVFGPQHHFEMRRLQEASGLVLAADADAWALGRLARGVQLDREGWLRLRIGGPTLVAGGGVTRVEYVTVTPAHLEALQVTRTTVTIGADFALAAKHAPVGEVRCQMAPILAIPGRPFVDEAGEPLRAPLVRRGDWT